MLKKIIFFVLSLFSISANRSNGTFTRVHRFQYPESFRDHVSDTLSEKGKELFYTVNIHPLCLEKKGQCIPRAHCIGKDMLYLSRYCYKRDLVCCYDSTIRFPSVGNIHYTPPSTTTDPTTNDSTITDTYEDEGVTTGEEEEESNADETSLPPL